MIEPGIADKLTIIWIGGRQGKNTKEDVEDNMNIYIPAAQAIFNKSNISVWQVPRETYDNTVMSMAEMQTKILPHGELGKYLTDKIFERMNILSRYFKAETYTMGDNPLTLLSALQAFYEKEATSSDYSEKYALLIQDEGSTVENPDGRKIRIYTHIDLRLIFDDLEAKLALWNNAKK